MATLADIILQANPMAAFGRATNYGQNVGRNVQSVMAMKMHGREWQQQQAARQQQMQLAQQAAKRSQQLFPSQLLQSQFKAQHPYANLPGAAGQYGRGLSLVKDNPIGSAEYNMGMQIIKSANAAQALQQSTAQRNISLANTQASRSSPTSVKLQQYTQLQRMGYTTPEVNDIMAKGQLQSVLTGASDAPKPLYPDLAAKQAVETKSAEDKQTHSTVQLNASSRVATAQNLTNSLQGYMQQMMPYFGAAGAIRLKKDQVNATLGGLPSSAYQAYRAYRQIYELHKNDMRATFTGPQTSSENKALDGIAPSAQNLLTMTPELAQNMFGTLHTILGDQQKTIKNNIEQNFNSKNVVPMADHLQRAGGGQTSLQPKVGGTVKMTYQGKVWDMPSDKVKAALKGGMTYARQ